MKKHLIRLGLACMALCAGGCATERYVTDARHPEIAIKADGGVTYREKFVDPEDLPGLLKDSGFIWTSVQKGWPVREGLPGRACGGEALQGPESNSPGQLSPPSRFV